MTHDDDTKQLDQLLRLAAATGAQGNYPIAAALLDENGAVIHYAVNTTIKGFAADKAGYAQLLDSAPARSSGHAERNLVEWLEQENDRRREAGQETLDPARLTILTTLCPCTMCMDAIARSGIGQVRYAAEDPLVATGAAAYAEGSPTRARVSQITQQIGDERGHSPAIDDIITRCQQLSNNAMPRIRDVRVKQFAVRPPRGVPLYLRPDEPEPHPQEITPEERASLNAYVLEQLQAHDADIRFDQDCEPEGAHALERQPMDLTRRSNGMPSAAMAALLRQMGLLAGHAAKHGHRADAATVLDPTGRLLCVVGDRSDRDHIFATAPERALTIMDALYHDAPPDIAKFIPHPSHFTLICHEPQLGTAARMAGMTLRDIHVLGAMRDGFASEGHHLPGFYLLQRGLAQALRNVHSTLDSYILRSFIGRLNITAGVPQPTGEAFSLEGPVRRPHGRAAG